MSATERCSLTPKAFNVLHSFLWTPELLQMIFEEGAIQISYILPV